MRSLSLLITSSLLLCTACGDNRFGGAPDPDGGAPNPDASTPDPDGATPDPDASAPNPDASAPDPDGGTPDPDGGTPDPDSGQVADAASDGGEVSSDASPDGPAPLDAGGSDGSVPPLADREQGGGATTAIVLDGGRAYIGIGPRLAIWDVADPSAPAFLGQTAPFEENVVGVAVSGTFAYVTSRLEQDGHVHVVDVVDASRPAVTRSFRLGTSEAPIPPGGILIADGRLYVGHAEGGLSIFDLAEPSAPALIKKVRVAGGDRMQRVGSRLYYLRRSFLGGTIVGALDLSADLADLGTAVVDKAIGASVNPHNILVTVGPIGLSVVDLTDLKHPIVRLHDDDPKLFARTVTAGEKAAWVPGTDGLYAIDISTKLPIKTGPVAMPTLIGDASAQAAGLVGIVTDRGRLVLADVSAPMAPVARGVADVSLCTGCIGVFATGDDIFIADGGDGLRTGRRSDLSARGRAHPGDDLRADFEDIEVAGGVAYAADWFFGLRIYDVADPSAPRPLGTFEATAAASVAFANGRIYLGEAAGGGLLRVIDVADPMRPKQVGVDRAGKVWDVQVPGGGLAYVSSEAFSEDGGVRIFDVMASPIRLVGHYNDPDCQYATDVAIAGTIAVVACSSDGFRLVSVADPAAPKKIGEWQPPSPSSAWSVAVDGTRAYLGYDYGMAAIDITNPAAPVLIAERKVSYTVRDLFVPAPGRVIASCGLGGVVQWNPVVALRGKHAP